MRISKTIYQLFALSILFSCAEPDIKPELDFQWKESEFSMPGSSFHAFATGDDGELYAVGVLAPQKSGVFRASSRESKIQNPFFWREVAPWPASEFVAVNGSVYLFSQSTSIYGTVWRRDYDDIVFSDKAINGILRFDSRLILMGDFKDEMNVTQALASSADGITLDYIKVANGEIYPPIYLKYQSDDKIYFGDSENGTFVYDGISFARTELNFPVIAAIGSQDEVYNLSVITINNEYRFVVKKWIGNDGEMVGDVLPKKITIYRGYIIDNKFILTGYDRNTTLTAMFYLKGNAWIRIETPYHFRVTFTYMKKLFGVTSDGVIRELTAQLAVDGI